MSKFEDAIHSFPVLSWLSQHTKVYDRGHRNSYCDCPVCDGKKTLGVEREKKLFHCFRCNEGGYGGSTWNGKAHLVKMVSLLEKVSFREACFIIYKLSGIPDPPIAKQITPHQIIPSDALPLWTAPLDDPAVVYLTKRGVGHLKKISYVCLKGSYAGRVILPINFLGELIGFEAKAYIPNLKPKSLFPDWLDTYSSLYTSVHFNPQLGIALITESVVDAETFGVNCLGLFGNFKDGQLEPLLRLRDKGVKVLAWAMDWDAWKKQSKAILTKTLTLFENRVINLPSGADPNSLGSEKLLQLLRTAKTIRDEFDLAQATLEFGRFL